MSEALEIAQSLSEALASKRMARLEIEASRPPFKPRRHYASGLSGCARQLVYNHTHWDKKEPFKPELIAKFDDGNHEEKLLIQELLGDGFDVVESQVQLDDDRYWVTGKIDGKIKWHGKRIPFEVKRMNPYAFERMNTLEDFMSDPFMLKRLRQLTLYLFLHSEEAGLFILSDGLGDRKFIAVPLDFALAESILKDLDTANQHLKAGTLPDRIPYSSKVCGYCPHRQTCLPDMDFGAGAVIGTEEVAVALKRLEEIKPLVSEADKLKEEVKKAVTDKPIVIAGDFVVEGKWQERKVPAKPERLDRFWKWEFNRTTQKEQGEAI